MTARIIFAMPGNETMAGKLARLSGAELGALETRRFPDGESYMRIESDVRGKHAALVCTLARPDPQVAPLLLAAGALREWGALHVELIAPYLAYLRQDAHFEQGDALSAKHFARVLSGAFDSLKTIDPHLHRIRSLSEIYAIPTHVVHAAPLLGAWIAANVENPILIGPDGESRQWVADAAAAANAGYVVLGKRRKGDRAVDLEWPDMTAAVGKTPVVIDDIASSGETLLRVASGLAGHNLRKPTCVVVHALLADEDYRRLLPAFHRVVSTDAVPHVSNAIGVAPLLV